MTPDWPQVIQRSYPSCVTVVIRGPQAIVVDPGSLTDADEPPRLLTDTGDVPTVLCSHYHSDHVGAVAALQDANTRVAAHTWDADTVNRRDPQVCASKWLDQPVLPYRVDHSLTEGDTVSTELNGAPWLRDVAASIDRDTDRLADEVPDAVDPALTRDEDLIATTAPPRPSPVPVPWRLTDTANWP